MDRLQVEGVDLLDSAVLEAGWQELRCNILQWPDLFCNQDLVGSLCRLVQLGSLWLGACKLKVLDLHVGAWSGWQLCRLG